MRVADGSDVAEKNRDAVGHFDRQLVELGHLGRVHVQVDVVLVVAHASRARRDDDVGGRESIADIHRRQAVGVHLLGIEVHDDRALNAADWCGRRKPRYRKELQPNEIQAVVKELLLRERLAEDVELSDRNVRRVVRNNIRGRSALGRLPQDRLRDRVDLRDGGADVRARLEINLEHADPENRLRLDMLDSVNGRGIGALADDHQPALHVDRVEAGIAPDHHHDRQVDGGKNIHVHQGEREDAHHEHEQRHDRHRERASKS